ncbi:GntR family transcriptional regulator [Naasia aerilata]|uniref:GntR family transcriptional regulator n=1 Tax=Naasia aerilata TaxID=1162966 RepID=A0ABM8GES6_9MICO|nr:GntR family transcriptional regulator [Naasia aerilata]BDZ46842.1 GntR family transcriptional regulator [Naasia aerilata]
MDASSQTAQLYGKLRRSVLSLELMPGERLTERGLEAAFGASRTPARAALMRLETEGLVQRDGRGWRVAPIDLAEINAVAQYREAVETAGVRLAVATASDEDVAALGALLEASKPSGDEQDGVRAGADFHVELARLSGNPLLADGVGTSMVRLERTRWLEVRTAASREQAWREHRRILQAVASRDAGTAAALVAAHIEATNSRLLESLSAQQRTLGLRGLAIVGDPSAESRVG